MPMLSFNTALLICFQGSLQESENKCEAFATATVMNLSPCLLTLLFLGVSKIFLAAFFYPLFFKMETWIPKLRPLQNAIPINKYTKTRSDSNSEFKQTLLVENKVFLCALSERSAGVRKLHFRVGTSELPRAGRFM